MSRNSEERAAQHQEASGSSDVGMSDAPTSTTTEGSNTQGQQPSTTNATDVRGSVRASTSVAPSASVPASSSTAPSPRSLARRPVASTMQHQHRASSSIDRTEPPLSAPSRAERDIEARTGTSSDSELQQTQIGGDPVSSAEAGDGMSATRDAQETTSGQAPDAIGRGGTIQTGTSGSRMPVLSQSATTPRHGGSQQQPNSFRSGSVLGVSNAAPRTMTSPAARRSEIGAGGPTSATSLGSHLSQQAQGTSTSQSASASLFGFSGSSVRARLTSLDDMLHERMAQGHAGWRTSAAAASHSPQPREVSGFRPPYLVAQQQQQQPRTAITSFLAPGATTMPPTQQQGQGGNTGGWRQRAAEAGAMLAGSANRTHQATNSAPFPSPRFLPGASVFPTSQVSTGTASGWMLADPAGWSNWANADRVGSAFEENQIVLFTWTIPETELLRDEVEQSPFPSEVERSVSAGAGRSEVWTTQPIFGDGKWKLELVRSPRPAPDAHDDAGTQGGEGTDRATASTTVLSVYLTSMVLDYSPPDLEIPATVMIGIRPPQSQVRPSREEGWIWRRFFNFTFRQENEYLECHDLPTISALLENEAVRTQDSFNLTVQVSTGPRATPSARALGRLAGHASDSRHGNASPFVVEDNQLVHHSLMYGLESLIDCRATGDVLLIAREKGVRRQPAPDADGPEEYGGNVVSDIVPVPIGAPEGHQNTSDGQHGGGVYVRDRVLWAHSSILCARSDFFKVMLESNFAEGQEIVIEGRRIKCLRMQDSDYTTAYWFLRYLYLEEVNFEAHENVRNAALDDDWLSIPPSASQLPDDIRWDWTPIEHLDEQNAYVGRSEGIASHAAMGSADTQPSASVMYHSAHLRSTVSSRQQQYSSHSSHPSADAGARAPASPTFASPASTARHQPSAHLSETSSPYHGFSRSQHRGSGSGDLDSRLHSSMYAATTQLDDATAHDHLFPRMLAADQHQHPCERPPPASALALYRLAHRYHQEGLLHLAKAHIVGTLTPQTAFAVLLATSVYEDLHAHVKTYLLDKWDIVAQTPEFERCCDEVSAGEWGTDAGRALRAFMRSLVSPTRG